MFLYRYIYLSIDMNISIDIDRYLICICLDTIYVIMLHYSERTPPSNTFILFLGTYTKCPSELECHLSGEEILTRNISNLRYERIKDTYQKD